VIDPRKLRPSELCRLLNSTPLGEVINQGQLRRHRTRAGLRIGDARHVDLARYVAWQVGLRHTPKPAPDSLLPAATKLAEAAQGAAALSSRRKQLEGHGQKLTSKQEALIAALLTEPTYAAAAAKAGVGETTLYRWLHLREFRAAYRQARRELVEGAIGRIQAGTGQAVQALLDVACHGRRDSDRVRAAGTLLDHALRGLAEADVLNSEQQGGEAAKMNPADVVQMLSARLRQLDAADMPTGEKSRLTATLADALLAAFAIDDLGKKIEALEAVLLSRKDHER
jgi:hypothetical protein